MNIGPIIQYATLFSILIGGLGLAVAVLTHREQLKTQLFLALSARYDEVMQRFSPGVWLSMPLGTRLPDRTEDLTMSVLRFYTLISLMYLLFLEHSIPKRLWHLILHSAEHRFRNPLFAREWEHLRSEFESFSEFVALVASVQQGTQKSDRLSGTTNKYDQEKRN